MSYNVGKDNPMYGTKRHHSKQTREKMSKAMKGRFSGKDIANWKGDDVGYQGLHKWVQHWKKKPKKCQHCGKVRRLYWANKSHKYLRKLSDWLALCMSCHRKYDINHARKNKITV